MRYRGRAPLRDRIARQAPFWWGLCLELATPTATAAPAPGPSAAGVTTDESVLHAPPAGAVASSFAFHVECQDLSAEQAAEVEVRARAALLTSGAALNEASLACDSEKVTATVSADQTLVLSLARTTGVSVHHLMVEAFEAAVARLSAQAPAPPRSEPEQAKGSEPGAASPPARIPFTPALPPVDAAVPALRREPPRTPRAARSPRRTEVEAGVALESWSGDAATGPLAGVSYGGPALSLALQLEALLPLRDGAAYRALELSAGIAVRWQPGWLLGVRFSVGVGASWLSAAPREPYESNGPTGVSAGFLTASLCRPIWFGSWGLLPEGGVRLFGGKRSVTLDRDTLLSLPTAAQNLALGLSRRFD